jgi:hypothetical protein
VIGRGGLQGATWTGPQPDLHINGPSASTGTVLLGSCQQPPGLSVDNSGALMHGGVVTESRGGAAFNEPVPHLGYGPSTVPDADVLPPTTLSGPLP